MAARIVRIGTAGWSIPTANREAFPGAGSILERYARKMNCVEINSSFYRPHRRETYERWAASTPADFRFSLKTPRQLTQFQRLRDPEAGLDRFAGEVQGLGRKLGVLLVQLPPSLKREADIAEHFFLALRERLPASIACEPRHASWFTPEGEQWLKRLRIARVAADPAPAPGGHQPGGWRGLTYMRLHGSPRIYWSAYSAAYLAETATRLAEAGPKTWCIFDNTAAGCALGDAMTVAHALKRAAD
jgi:uncharacterized protein YecE (DUF72 family)